jgi:hypothetical protein
LAQHTAPWHEARVRLSRPRVLLRLALLLVGAGFMAWKGWDTGAAAHQAGLAPGQALLLHRVALVEWLLAALALGTAAAAGLALRRRPARRKLGLVEEEPPGGQKIRATSAPEK